MRARRISFVSLVPGMVVVAAFSLFAATQMHRVPHQAFTPDLSPAEAQQMMVEARRESHPAAPTSRHVAARPIQHKQKGKHLSLPLPAGWVAVNQTYTINSSFRCRFYYKTQPVIVLYRTSAESDQCQIQIGNNCFIAITTDNTFTNGGKVYAFNGEFFNINSYPPAGAVVIGDTAVSSALRTSDWFTVTFSVGPFRLGNRITDIGPTSPAPTPRFPQLHNQRQYTWFADDTTVQKTTVTGPLGAVTYSVNLVNPGATVCTVQGNQVGQLKFGYLLNTSAVGTNPSVEFDSLVLDGKPLDTSEMAINTGGMLLTGNGSNGAIGAATIGSNHSASPAPRALALPIPPWRVRYLLNITGHKTTSTQGNGSGIALLNELNGEDLYAHLLDSYYTPLQIDSRDGTQNHPQLDFVSTPRADAVDFVIPNVSWPVKTKSSNGVFSFNVDPVWAAAQDPPMDTGDLSVPVLTVPGTVSPSNPDTILYNPNGDGSNYFPATINRANAISIQRPDAHVTPPSYWTSSDVTKLVVTDPDTIDNTRTKIVVSTVGAKISRSLVSHWRNWLVKMTPEFIVDGYKILVHNYDPGNGFPHTNEDIWAWPAYGYVRATVTMPVSATLTMTINGVYLDTAGSDNHHTGQIRVDDLTVTEIPYTKSYDVNVQIQTPNGTAYGDFDILMPSDKSGPFYPSRVDSISISGWPAGTCYLNDLALQAHGSGYFKCDYGPPRGRKMDSNDPLQQPTVDRNNIQVRFDAAHIAIDGSFVYGNQADQYLKGSEIGQYGGSVRFVEPLTGDPSGIIMDAQKTLANFVGDMAYVEGITTSYSQAVDDAANKDSFGNSLGGSLAQNMIPVVPYHQFTLGYSPPCAWPVKSIQITNGLTYVVRVLWPIQAGREGLAVTVDNLRANKKNSQNNIQPRVAARRKDKNLGGTPPGLIVTSSPTDDEGYYVVWPLPANGPDLPAITAPNYNPVPALIAVPYDIEPA